MPFSEEMTGMTPSHPDSGHASSDARDMTGAMARNVADWHGVSVRALGIRTHTTDSLWWREPGGSGIYVAAIPQGPESDALYADLQEVKERWGINGIVVYDAWNLYKSQAFRGEVLFASPWYLRMPAPFTAPKPPDGLTIKRVTTGSELEAFERASIQGFADADEPPDDYQPFTQHAVATLDDRNMVYLNAYMDGQVVAGVIAHITDGMLGIYGLSTLLRYRRRGYARALIHACIALRPDLSASVHPDPESVPIYTEIGFQPAGDIAVWKTS